MIRVDLNARTVTTDDKNAELAELADVFESDEFQMENGVGLAVKWASTRQGPNGLATMQYDADEYDALEEAFSAAGLYLEDEE